MQNNIGSKIKISKQNLQLANQFPSRGIFLTGIENSDPLVNDGLRRDQLREAHDFYENYIARLGNIKKLGISWIRFGCGYSLVHTGKDAYDFGFSDAVIEETSRLGLEVVADLLHFGLPEWMHAENPHEPFFQNPNFPEHFSRYAAVFARRYHQIKYFTIVNEPFITATFSTKLGIWNESIGTEWDDDRAFVRASYNIAKAAILSRKAIEQVWRQEGRAGSPIFVQNDSFEKAFDACSGYRTAEAERFNMRRFAPLDLIFGKRDRAMKNYLLGQGLLDEEYEWCMREGSKTQTVLGIDHYPTCIHTYTETEIINHDPGSPNQLKDLIKEYWDRYKLPLLHLEVNGWPDYATGLCLQTFDALQQLRREGYPILGMSWFGDEYQVGWHSALSGPDSFTENPVGLFYKGELQPVGEMFQKLAAVGFEN